MHLHAPSSRDRWIDAVDVRLGVWLAVCGVMCGLVYCALTPHGPHRGLILAILGLGLVSTLGVRAATPWLLRAPRRAELFFPSWSVSYIAIIAVLTALDGGPRSPLGAFFFVPVAFAALAYPMRQAALVTSTSVLAFTIISFATGGFGDGQVLVLGGALFSTGALGVVQARRQEERHAELAEQSASLRESEQRLRGGFEHSPVGMAIVAPDGRYLQVNDALCSMLGRSRDELATRRFVDVTHPDDAEDGRAFLATLLSGEADHAQVQKRYLRPDGGVVCAIVSVSVIRRPDRSISLFHCQALDVTEEREATRRAHRRATQQAAVAALGQAALAGLAIDDLLEEAADAVTTGLETTFAGLIEILPDGCTGRTAARGLAPKPALPPGSGGSQTGLTFATGEPVLMRDATTEQRFVPSFALELGVRSGVTVPIPGLESRPFGVLGSYAIEPDFFDADDVSYMQALANVIAGALGRESAEQLLRHQSLHDSLTRLPNRALLLDRLGHAMSRSERTDEMLGVLFLDVDHFKTVNDAYGHEAGDELLRVLTPRLERVLRQGDTLARFGGDEFVVLCEGLRDPRDAVLAAERLLAVFSEPFVLGSQGEHPTEHHLSASIGVAVAGPEHVADPASLIRDADTAMYRAKRSRGRVEVFDQHTRARVVARVRTTSELRRALDNDELFVHYQPIVSLRDGAMQRVEALVRWEHPERGVVSPAEFIPLAEESGLILPLGAWVLDRTLAQLAAWDAGDEPRLRGLRGAINLSARQLVEPDVPAMVARKLAAHGIAPSRLVCEITETALIDDPERAAENVEALHAEGVLVSLDDFCTGYSALEHLKRFPLCAIKLDRTFVADVATNPADLAIVRGLVEIAGAMEIDTVAEGVESAEQLSRLRDVGCDLAQGYLFAPPLAPEALADYVAGLLDGRVDFAALAVPAAA